jgi:hypothetical protein
MPLRGLRFVGRWAAGEAHVSNGETRDDPRRTWTLHTSGLIQISRFSIASAILGAPVQLHDREMAALRNLIRAGVHIEDEVYSISKLDV